VHCLGDSEVDLRHIKQLETYLELIIPKKDRKVNGAFFTPDYIVNFMVQAMEPRENDKCLDPSCGCGAFLIGLIEYYKKKFRKTIKQTIRENIFGSDILNYNVTRAKLLLSIYGLLHEELIEESDFNIVHQDSLKASWKTEFDVIIGNPPYVKYQDLSAENRNYLVDNWTTVGRGSFNLYFAFFELGYRLLSKAGRLSYITPNNYFTSLAGLSLRSYFIQQMCLTRIIDFRDRKVFSAQTYTAITFADKGRNKSLLYDRIADGQDCPEFLLSTQGSPNLLKDLHVNKWRLLKTPEQNNIHRIETIGTPIKQLFDIAVGIATLKDEVFFVDGATEEYGLLKKNTEYGAFLIEKSITKPVYKISNFKNQDEVNLNTLRIIVPYRISGKTSVPIPEDEFKAKYPHCYQYLLSQRKKLEKRDKGKRKFSPFYVWGRTQGISRKGKKIINPTFSRKPRFLWVEEEDSYFTNGYGIFFNTNHAATYKVFPPSTHTLPWCENVATTLKILNSAIMDYYVSTTSVSIQGGFPCYQKNFIEKFTIPNFTEQELETLNQLEEPGQIDTFLIRKYQLNLPTPRRV
jgi:type I restriction-modification system DNA methylase subunit